ncbi:hypothetical protein [Sorangium sp. So ce1335]|uniref:hypothetical protein n=1 Tax=Sorangium sp. So ce1335 TaxID=3133335 RepID=UPI003F634E58
MNRSLVKARSVFCAGLFVAAGGCNDLIGLDVGEADPTAADAAAPSSSSAVGASAGGASAGGASAGGASAGGASAGGPGAGGGDGGSGAGEPTCGEASGAATVEASALWGDTVGADMGGVAALDDEVTTVVNAPASPAASASLTVARWSSSGVRQDGFGLSASGFRGTHVAVAPGVTVVAGESLGGASLSGERCAIGSSGGGGSNGGEPSFVAALNAAGQCAWAWSVASDGGTAVRGVAALSDAVVLAVESSGKGKSHGPCAMRPGVPEDASFLAALDPATGACRWHRSLGAPAAVKVRALAGAPAGPASVVVVGEYDATRGAVSFGEDPSRSPDGRGIFLVRHTSSTDAPQRVTTLALAGAQRVEPLGAAQLPDGDVVIAGRYAGALDLEDTCPGMPDAGNTDNVFVARVSEHGAVWSRGFGDATAAQKATGVAVDGAGAIHVTGLFSGELDLGSAGKLAAPAGRREGFVLTLDANGNLVSASRLAGDTVDLRVVAAGRAAGAPLYVAGSLDGPLELGGLGDLLGAGPRGFIARLSDAR